jgi:DNA modification methylase
MQYQILQGDNRDTLRTLADNSIDAIVTDPPYGIDFLGKAWDANVGALETYKECLRVLKPGGHILAFSAARTYHHLAVTLEQAGFEIRDQIMWIYSSGFPKSQNVGKSIDRQSGKAAHKAELSEVKAILKKLYTESGKSTAEISRECGFNAGGYLKTDFNDKGWANNLPKDDKWLTLKSVLGCGNDYDDYFITTPQVKIGEKESGCFDQDFDNYTIGARSKTVDITQSQTPAGQQWSGWGTALKPAHEPIVLARKPIKLSIAKNCQRWGTGALNIDATRVPYANDKDKDSAKGFGDYENLNRNGGPTFRDDKPKPGKMGTTTHDNYNAEKNADQGLRKGEQQDWIPSEAGRFPSNVIGEIPEYQKYFYCPKVSRAERHVGFDTTNIPTNPSGMLDKNANGVLETYQSRQQDGTLAKGNNHPTVKPIELMKYLIKLITPPGGTVLDPFNGSGSTGCAAVELGHPYIGCELDDQYVAIAKTRIEAWHKQTHPNTYAELFELC